MSSVIINDVGPRDGLQNHQKILNPDQRVQLVEALLAAGLRHIEVGAFVSPKAVPAMAGAAAVLAGLPRDDSRVFTVLVPNFKGFELARNAGAKSVSTVLYGTNAMAQANVRMSRAEAEQATAEIIAGARQDGIRVTATIAVAFECPFDGPVDPAVTREITARFLEIGADELAIADTIGAAHPLQVRSLTEALVSEHGHEQLSCHFHDTRAMGLANVFAAVESGIRKFDTAIGGLGGCPFAPGASGNVATEDVVMMLEQMGFDTGISLVDLLRASALAQKLTGAAPGGRARAWLERSISD